MKNAANIVKWVAIAIVAIVIFLALRRCGNVTVKPTKIDTISSKVDMVIHHYDTVVVKVPVPYKVTYHDTLETDGEPTIAYLPIDSFPLSIRKMLNEYNATKYYKDSLILKYGKVYVNDTLRWNRITGQSIAADLSIPEITRTVTLNAARRTVGLIGGEVLGNKSTPFYAVGASFGLMFRNQKYYGIGALLDKNGNVWYSGRAMFPIRLHK